MKKRFYELDLFRFLAAFSVLMYHFTFRGYVADKYSYIDFPISKEIFKYGYLGVDLFFIISGFVILLSVESKTAKEFVISRIIRLYPTFLICVSLTYLTIIFMQQDIFQVSFWEYLVNLTMLNKFLGVKSVDGVYWTLSVELRFYFWIFVFLIVKQMHNLKFLYVFMLILSAIDLIYEQDILNKLFFLEWNSYFVAGCIFYTTAKEGVKKLNTLLLLSSYILSIIHGINTSDEISKIYDTEFNRIVVFSIISSFYAVFLLLISGKIKFVNHPNLFYLGVSTYPLYLIHQNIGFIMMNVFHGFVNKYLLLAGVTLFMISLSYIIWHYGEKNLEKHLKRLFNKKS